MHQNLTDINELLNREAALASQQLGSGLSTIRKYDFSSKGVFYSGMFSICIGVERILKLIALLDYRCKNDHYPENRFLKDKGHKINDLVTYCRAIVTDIEQKVFDDSLSDQILNFLTDFAVSSRYYNLDAITGKFQANNEPMARWDNEICSEIINRHPPSPKKLAKYAWVGNKINNISVVSHTLENGVNISNAKSLFESAAFIENKQSYSVYYLYKIISWSVALLKSLDFQLTPQLYLREHFINLEMYDTTCSAIRRRKNWCKI